MNNSAVHTMSNLAESVITVELTEESRKLLSESRKSYYSWDRPFRPYILSNSLPSPYCCYGHSGFPYRTPRWAWGHSEKTKIHSM